jgi:hypothetical protein
MQRCSRRKIAGITYRIKRNQYLVDVVEQLAGARDELIQQRSKGFRVGEPTRLGEHACANARFACHVDADRAIGDPLRGTFQQDFHGQHTMVEQGSITINIGRPMFQFEDSHARENRRSMT